MAKQAGLRIREIGVDEEGRLLRGQDLQDVLDDVNAFMVEVRGDLSGLSVGQSTVQQSVTNIIAAGGGGAGGPTDHNALSNRQGGVLPDQSYHLSQADYDALVDANAQLTELQTDGSPEWVGAVFSGLTASELVATDGSKALQSLPVATYPSLTEIAYVKGVTSSIQTQLNGKEPTISAGTSAQYWRGDKAWATLNQAAVAGLTTADSPTLAGLTLSGLTPSHVVYAGAGGVLSGDAGLSWSAANKRLCLGGADADAVSTQAGIHMEHSSYLWNWWVTAATSAFPILDLVRARGTPASPAAVQTDDLLGRLSFGGHDGANWLGGMAGWRAYANENWSGSQRGNRLEYWGVVDGGTAVTRWLIAVNRQWQFLDGSAALPSLSFTDDTDTGSYRIGDDIYGIATGGVGRVRVSSAGLAITSGTLLVGTYAAKAAEAFAGYITIKDAAGNDRKVMVCA